MYGLDLFSGIGGITLALHRWVKPVAYCEIDKYCQSVLLQRMQEGNLPQAPIWDDVQTLPIKELPPIDIIYGGFPCQDISVAGLGKGLEGERSGLFFEIMRLVREAKPTFVFLENVPAIRTRGLDRVLQELTKEWYDCRWTMLSAKEVGARHKRERWFLLAKSSSKRRDLRSDNREERHLQDDEERESKKVQPEGDKWELGSSKICTDVAYSMCKESRGLPSREEKEFSTTRGYGKHKTVKQWQETVSNVCRTTDGVLHRVDRIKALGNSVVPLQVETAFKRLMGIKDQPCGIDEINQ